MGSQLHQLNVRTQLAEQQIHFPPKVAFAHAKSGTRITPSMIPSVSQHAGQQLLNDAQAEVYADHFIAVHLSELPYGGVYSTISAAALANPTDVKLKALEQTSFQGTTLRGLLLEAYAFSKIGQIMLWGAIASFIMAILVGLGFRHARRTAPEEDANAPGSDPDDGGGAVEVVSAQPFATGPPSQRPQATPAGG